MNQYNLSAESLPVCPPMPGLNLFSNNQSIKVSTHHPTPHWLGRRDVNIGYLGNINCLSQAVRTLSLFVK